jgi:CRP/FNR family transcriptional regulator, cyclic AMP receptor protein
MSPPRPESLSVLESCMVFRSLGSEDRQLLAKKAHRRRFEARQPIFREGDPGDSLLAVASGLVRISVTSSKGREIILSDVGLNEIFGEIAVLDGLGRSADATAIADTELLVIDRRDIVDFLAQRPEACLKLLALVCARLRVSDERMLDIADSELAVRLAKTLLRRGIVAEGGSLAISLSQTDLAAIVSSSREAINRQLSAWQRGGVVEIQERAIFVRREADLAVVAGLDRDGSPAERRPR